MLMNKFFLAATLLVSTSAVNAAFYDDLAYYHAPIHYQDTDSSNYPAEYITAVDYDSDWASTNNWDNLGTGNLSAKVYFSVTESCSHYFITYGFFHPRDWTDTAFDQEHENDMEGALFVVRKNASTYGALEGVITVFHNDFFSFTPAGSPFVNGSETIDGSITFTNFDGSNRARLAQEAKGHGVKAWPYIGNFTGDANQDGIIYFPSRTISEVPASGNDRSVYYTLVNMTKANGLWSRALLEAPVASASAQTFNSWGNFKGDTGGGCGAGLPTCSSNSANTSWGWDDQNDGNNYRGAMALDPISLTDYYFNGLGSFSVKYINNQFLKDLQTAGYTSSNLPAGFAGEMNLSQLYTKLGSSCP